MGQYRKQENADTSPIALSEMLIYFNKHHEVSPLPSYYLPHFFWQGIQKIRVMKCPLNLVYNILEEAG